MLRPREFCAELKIMLKRFSLSIIFVLAIASSLNGYQSEWVKLAPVGGGFSVMMPGKADEDVKPADEFTSHLFTVTTDKAIYLVSYGDYAPSIRLDVDGELIANRDNFLKGLNATLIESKKITMDGHAGLEFKGESSQASFKSRVYLFGNRVHQLAVAVFKGKDDTDNVNRFFAFFSFTDDQAHPKP
jgi:hypothetical protein